MAEGAGMVAVSIALFTLFKASKLTRKNMIALPSKVVDKAAEMRMTTVEKS